MTYKPKKKDQHLTKILYNSHSANHSLSLMPRTTMTNINQNNNMAVDKDVDILKAPVLDL